MRLDIKINDEEATPLACIVHRDKSYQMGKALTEKLKELIPRQLFKVRLFSRLCLRVGLDPTPLGISSPL